MKITTNHPSSSYGIPVILTDDGEPMTPADGIRALRAALNLSIADLAKITNYSPRTVEGWEQGRPVPPSALNVMASLLHQSPK